MKKTIIVLSAIMLSGIMQAQILKEVTPFSSEITEFSIDTLRAYKTTDAEYLIVLNDVKDQLDQDIKIDLKKEQAILKKETKYLKTQQKSYKDAKKQLANRKKFYKTEIKNYKKELKNVQKECDATLATITDPEMAQSLTKQYEDRTRDLRSKIDADTRLLNELNTTETERLKNLQLAIAHYEADLKAKTVRIKAITDSTKTHLAIIKNEIKTTETIIKGSK